MPHGLNTIVTTFQVAADELPLYQRETLVCRDSQPLPTELGKIETELLVKIGIRSLGHCPMTPHLATNIFSLDPRLRRQAPRRRRGAHGFGA